MKPMVHEYKKNSRNNERKIIFTFAIFLFSIALFSQTTVSGKVVDEKGNSISGANIFIEGTYDGTSSNETGDFTFITTTTANQTLVVSFLVYETYIA